MMLRSLSLSLLALAGVLSSACWVESEHDHSSDARTATAVPAGSNTTPDGDALPNAMPVLVEVDTGRTLNAEPGEGVGIFVEYAAGGQWHVWWTCDTAKTAASCEFDVRIASESGDLESIHSEGVLSSDSVTSTDARTISARSSTGSNAVGVRFEGPVGGIVAIDAAVGGVRETGYFFFVQDDKPNGGFTGPLTNPLRFKGKTP